MALYFNTCPDFIDAILKTVSKDYNLNFGDLKRRYGPRVVVEKAKKKSRSKSIKKVVPVHTHPLCTTIQKDCPLCQAHGNIMYLGDFELEVNVG